MQTIELNVLGMRCGSCVAAVSGALRRVPGVQDVAVNLGAGTARVQGEHVAQQVAELVAALGAAGYRAGQGGAAAAPARQASTGCGTAAAQGSQGRGCCCGGAND